MGWPRALLDLAWTVWAHLATVSRLRSFNEENNLRRGEFLLGGNLLAEGAGRSTPSSMLGCAWDRWVLSTVPRVGEAPQRGGEWKGGEWRGVATEGMSNADGAGGGSGDRPGIYLV